MRIEVSNKDRLEHNVYRTLLLGYFQVFLVIMSVAVPFFQGKGLSMQEVFSLQALFGLVVLLTEVPSGYLADVLGRKNTLVVGAIVAALGHSCLLFAEGFWTLAMFELLLGISHSLISGADLALLYDTELALGRSEEEQRKVVGKLYSPWTFSEASASVVCSLVILYAVWLLQQVWQEQEIAIAHFGWLWVGLTLIAALSGRWAYRLEARFGAPRVLCFIGLAPVIGYLGMDAWGIVGGVLASSSFFVARGVGLVILKDAFNKRVPSEFRATANSLASFGFRGAFVLTGPFVGSAFDLWGMSVTLAMLVGVTLLIFVGLIVPLAVAVRNQQQQMKLEVVEG